jgi:hypothetical protein
MLPVLLSACATGSSRTEWVCPSLVEYSTEEQGRAANELAAQPAGSVLAKFVVDYGRLREQVRACRAR